jgi:DNA (cytosine-5)-methyltransferase 1
MTAYYNEIDPYAAAWLRNLIAAGHIANGVVDERSIVDVRPKDLAGFTQVHLFAGIGGWSHAARLAGWPDDRPLWTGSCPCQPFSVAGKGAGTADERHLWPEMFRLVAALRPPVVAGEQVASRAGLDWLDGVCADLEGAGYATGAADLCAAGVGAPHIRQRLWWVAHTSSEGPQGSGSGWGPRQGREGGAAERGGEACGMANALGRGRAPFIDAGSCDAPDRGGEGNSQQNCGSGWMGDANSSRHEGDRLHPLHGERQGREQVGGIAGPGATGFWSRADWIPCRDGKARPVEPGTFPLAHGATARVGRLRAYGNAIVPQVAAQILIATATLIANRSKPTDACLPHGDIAKSEL